MAMAKKPIAIRIHRAFFLAIRSILTMSFKRSFVLLKFCVNGEALRQRKNKIKKRRLVAFLNDHWQNDEYGLRYVSVPLLARKRNMVAI